MSDCNHNDCSHHAWTLLPKPGCVDNEITYEAVVCRACGFEVCLTVSVEGVGHE